MKYNIDKTQKKTAYLQLYEQVRADIIGGVLPYGAKLPSKRLVSDEAGISTVTVEHAYALLADEGYIEPRERSGYFVSFHAEDFPITAVAHSAPAKKPEMREVRAAEFPFSVLAKTMRRVISDYGEAILEKSPNSGCSVLCDAISQYLMMSRGICAKSEQIIIGSGAEYLYGLAVELLGRDKIYGIESPSYEKIEQVYRAADVSYESLPLTSDGIDSSALSRSRADILHITPYRSFPSGVTASASKRHEYIRWASKNGRYIVEDDFESEFSVSKKTEETLFSMSSDENIIYINTFSKSISSSLRVGYMVLPDSLLPRFREKLGFYSCTVPTFEQYVIAELIANGDFERHINRTRRKIRKGI